MNIYFTHRKRVPRVVCALLVLLSGTVAAQELRLPGVGDRERIREPGAPQISPDGERVAFSENGTIYAVARDGAEPRALTSAASTASEPRWSADGRYLYFLSDRSGQSQLWKLPADTFGEASQVTTREQGIASGQLSPDERRILLVLSENDLAKPSAEEEGPPPPFVVTRRHFKRDAGPGYITARDTRHLYVYDIADDKLTQLTSGDDNETGGAWSPDGETVVYVSDRQPVQDAGYRTDIWTVPAAGGEPRRLTDSDEQKYSPAFSPDGKQIAYLAAGDGVYSVPQIVVMPAAGGERKILTVPVDRWIGRFEYSADGSWIYFSFDNAGSAELARVRVSDGLVERIVEGDVQVGSFDVGPRATLALNMNGRNDLADVHRLDGRRLTKLTDLNREYFDEILVGEKRKVSFASRDGTTVEAFITTPPGFDAGKKYPAILNIHGGPVGQFSWGYAFRAQFWAANGYVVVEPNPRGSTGFGEAYIRAIYRTWGITDYPDIMASIDYAIEAGIADPERLAVTGYSYGGYMTNIVITETNRFKAAASGAGHSLIEANFGHDIYQHWYAWELGTPWSDRENFDRLSPFLRADRVSTPTLYLGGRVDWNVPVLNAELMYQALKVRGIDTELVVYPDTHHGGWEEAYEQDYLVRTVSWFDKYLKD